MYGIDIQLLVARRIYFLDVLGKLLLIQMEIKRKPGRFLREEHIGGHSVVFFADCTSLDG